ncbi:MAG: hypothetical protein OEZ34_11700 [Spirochaetia bacterium]|nr:hypothetical protein [Spirochaetia bacterium]
MKKLKQSKDLRKKIAEKRHKRALRSKAKQAHRRGTGTKDFDDK